MSTPVKSIFEGAPPVKDDSPKVKDHFGRLLRRIRKSAQDQKK